MYTANPCKMQTVFHQTLALSPPSISGGEGASPLLPAGAVQYLAHLGPSHLADFIAPFLPPRDQKTIMRRARPASE